MGMTRHTGPLDPQGEPAIIPGRAAWQDLSATCPGPPPAHATCLPVQFDDISLAIRVERPQSPFMAPLVTAASNRTVSGPIEWGPRDSFVELLGEKLRKAPLW